MVLKERESLNRNNLSKGELDKGNCYSELSADIRKICQDRVTRLTGKENSKLHKFISGAVINIFEKEYKNKKAA